MQNHTLFKCIPDKIDTFTDDITKTIKKDDTYYTKVPIFTVNKKAYILSKNPKYMLAALSLSQFLFSQCIYNKVCTDYRQDKLCCHIGSIIQK